MMEYTQHQDALRRLCRVCGGPINVHRVSYSCTDHHISLQEAFSIEVLGDISDVHPARFCMRCSSTMRRKLKAIKEGSHFQQSIGLFRWTRHDLDCDICTHHDTIKKGGRPKNSRRKNCGRPSENGFHNLINHALQSSPASFYMDSMNYTSLQVHIPAFLNISSQDLECFICLGVLNSPLRLSCGPFVCSTCFVKSVEASQTVSCPACLNHSLTKADIQPLESLHFRLLEGISLKCHTCSQYVLLRNMSQHIESDCCNSTQENTIIPTQPIIEQRLSADAIRKMVHNGRVTIATGGQVQ